MKFTVDIAGQRQELEVTRRRDAGGSGAGEALTIVRDGERIDVRVVHRDGPYFILEIEENDGERTLRRRLRAAGHSDGAMRQLWVNGSNLTYELAEGAPGAASAGRAEAGLAASIPAVVSEILVHVGQPVSAGQKLILLESMKMILPIHAPHDGVVQALHCAVGQAVQPGLPLLELGAPAGDA